MPIQKPIRTLVAMAAAFLLGFSLLACTEENVAGTTVTGNTGKISGRIVDTQGNGVANAKVRVVSVNFSPGPGGAGDIADIVTTGADGSFATDSLPDGQYNLLSDKAGGFAFRDSVKVQGNSSSEIGRDTLKAPGSVAGVIRLQPGDDSRTVFLILLGTTTFAVPTDSMGNFRLDNLAEGQYRLRLLTTLDAYKPVDTLITVRSGIATTLSDTLRLPYQPVMTGAIPMVDSITLAYDTTAMVVTLRWKKQSPSQVSAYHVYRRTVDSGFIRLSSIPVADTVFKDDWKSGLKPGATYHYAIAALDLRGNEGRKGETAIFTMKVRFQIERLPNYCGPAACQFDMDSSGDIWVYEYDRTVTKSNGISPDRKWFDSAAQGGGFTRPLVVDSQGSVYILDSSPLRLRKHSTIGDLIWQRAVPSTANSLTLHRVGDSLLIWNEAARVMTTYNKDGVLLGQDSLLKQLKPPSGLTYPSFQPEIGFYSVVSFATFDRLEFYDRQGQITLTWKPEARGYLRGIARDKAGRWVLAWGNQVIDIYTPDRMLVGSILAGGDGPIRAQGDYIYMQYFPGNALARILPGF